MEALKLLLAQTRRRPVLLWAVAAFPFLSPPLIKRVAGLFYDWVYYSNYMGCISLAFMASALAMVGVAYRPNRIRWKVLLLGVLYALIGVFLPVSRCQEYLVLREVPGGVHYAEDYSRTAVSGLAPRFSQ